MAASKAVPHDKRVIGRLELVVLIAFLMSLNALAIDAMLPALPAMGEALNVADENRRQLVITFYLLGFGLAQLVYGPISDRVGRRPVLVVTMAFYAAFALLPLQRTVQVPVDLLAGGGDYLQGLQEAQRSAAQAAQQLAAQSLQVARAEVLARENEQLRALLALGPAIGVRSQAAEVLYDAADPYTRKVIIDKGLAQGVEAGSPVIDESGVLGQVTRVHPLISACCQVMSSIRWAVVRIGSRSMSHMIAPPTSRATAMAAGCSSSRSEIFPTNNPVT